VRGSSNHKKPLCTTVLFLPVQTLLTKPIAQKNAMNWPGIGRQIAMTILGRFTIRISLRIQWHSQWVFGYVLMYVYVCLFLHVSIYVCNVKFLMHSLSISTSTSILSYRISHSAYPATLLSCSSRPSRTGQPRRCGARYLSPSGGFPPWPSVCDISLLHYLGGGGGGNSPPLFLLS
jgi:hypothetical protein